MDIYVFASHSNFENQKQQVAELVASRFLSIHGRHVVYATPDQKKSASWAKWFDRGFNKKKEPVEHTLAVTALYKKKTGACHFDPDSDSYGDDDIGFAYRVSFGNMDKDVTTVLVLEDWPAESINDLIQEYAPSFIVFILNDLLRFPDSDGVLGKYPYVTVCLEDPSMPLQEARISTEPFLPNVVPSSYSVSFFSTKDQAKFVLDRLGVKK